jgi:drug/metabolite transporter (DMT)-like permease
MGNMSWLWFALLSAFSTSVVTPLNKKLTDNLSPVTILWLPGFLAIPIYVALILYFGLPTLNGQFGVILLGTVILEIISNLLVIYALKIEDISVVIPLLAISPAFAYFINIAFLQAPFNIFGILGICLVIVGAALVHLNFKKKRWGFKFSLGSILTILVSILWAFGTLGFVLGIKDSNLLSFVSAVNLITTILLIILDIFILKTVFPKKYIFHPINLSLTLFRFMSWIGEFSAVSMIAQPAYVGAVRKLDVLLSVVYGKLFWNEKHFWQKFFAGIVIIIGVSIIIFLG